MKTNGRSVDDFRERGWGKKGGAHPRIDDDIIVNVVSASKGVNRLLLKLELMGHPSLVSALNLLSKGVPA